MNLENKSKKYTKNNTLIYSCQYHVIFCPKYRRPVLVDIISKRLRDIILENQKKYDYRILEINIMPDHVHLLIDSDPSVGIYNQVNRIKGITSNLLRKEFPSLKSRLPSLWTRSKFISSVGEVSLDVVQQYIQDQKNV